MKIMLNLVKKIMKNMPGLTQESIFAERSIMMKKKMLKVVRISNKEYEELLKESDIVIKIQLRFKFEN